MYNNIKLEKGLYSITGKTFTQALAELDPDANYENTELKGLDAFERQLKRFDIKVKGANSDRVEKFFISTESAVLFPEYIRRTVKQGMDEASIMGKVAAAVSYTDGVKRRGGYIQEETKAVNGILRNISGKAAEIFQFSGRIAPSDKAYAWAALSENGGKTINFTADGVLYSGYILSEIQMDFQPDRMIGSLMIKLRGAE